MDTILADLVTGFKMTWPDAYVTRSDCPNCGAGGLKIIAAVLRSEPGHKRA